MACLIRVVDISIMSRFGCVRLRYRIPNSISTLGKCFYCDGNRTQHEPSIWSRNIKKRKTRSNLKDKPPPKQEIQTKLVVKLRILNLFPHLLQVISPQQHPKNKQKNIPNPTKLRNTKFFCMLCIGQSSNRRRRNGCSPTERAHGIIRQPSIRTSPMKRMATLRQHSRALPHLDIVQTNRTLCPLHRSSVLEVARQPLQLRDRQTVRLFHFCSRSDHSSGRWLHLHSGVCVPEHADVRSEHRTHSHAHHDNTRKGDPWHHVYATLLLLELILEIWGIGNM